MKWYSFESCPDDHEGKLEIKLPTAGYLVTVCMRFQSIFSKDIADCRYYDTIGKIDEDGSIWYFEQQFNHTLRDQTTGKMLGHTPVAWTELNELPFGPRIGYANETWKPFVHPYPDL